MCSSIYKMGLRDEATNEKKKTRVGVFIGGNTVHILHSQILRYFLLNRKSA